MGPITHRDPCLDRRNQPAHTNDAHSARLHRSLTRQAKLDALRGADVHSQTDTPRVHDNRKNIC